MLQLYNHSRMLANCCMWNYTIRDIASVIKLSLSVPHLKYTSNMAAWLSNVATAPHAYPIHVQAKCLYSINDE